MLLLTKSDVKRAVTMAEAIEAAEAGLAAYSSGEAKVPVRTPVITAGGVGLYMPGLIESRGAMGIKIVSVFAGNPARGLPTVTGLMVLNNVETGEPVVAMEASYLTALRTGAAGGVAAKHLVRDDARTAVLFGAGIQARAQFLGLVAVRSIERAYVFDIDVEVAERFAAEMGPETGVKIVPGRAGGSGLEAARAEAAVAEADAILTATTSRTPVFDGRSVRPGTHVTGIGSYTPDMQEMDEDLVARADLLFCDTKEGAWAEAGDLLKPFSMGLIDRNRVDGELGDLVLGRLAGRTHERQITVYKGVGLAALDLATAKLVYDRAIEQEMGVRIDLLS
jgi:ornithine cyclodeaminase/alanine dehydrogenase-like protein (mu-crystallin family)